MKLMYPKIDCLRLNAVFLTITLSWPWKFDILVESTDVTWGSQFSRLHPKEVGGAEPSKIDSNGFFPTENDKKHGMH